MPPVRFASQSHPSHPPASQSPSHHPAASPPFRPRPGPPAVLPDRTRLPPRSLSAASTPPARHTNTNLVHTSPVAAHSAVPTGKKHPSLLPRGRFSQPLPSPLPPSSCLRRCLSHLPGSRHPRYACPGCDVLTSFCRPRPADSLKAPGRRTVSHTRTRLRICAPTHTPITE